MLSEIITTDELRDMQRHDSELYPFIAYIEKSTLPPEDDKARIILLQKGQFNLDEEVLS